MVTIQILLKHCTHISNEVIFTQALFLSLLVLLLAAAFTAEGSEFEPKYGQDKIVPKLSRWHPTAAGSHVRFVVDKVELGRVFSEYFGFPFHSFLRLLHSLHPLSGTGIEDQIVANVPS
jgi:hypothetical protein